MEEEIDTDSYFEDENYDPSKDYNNNNTGYEFKNLKKLLICIYIYIYTFFNAISNSHLFKN